jgi:hypothetical protein
VTDKSPASAHWIRFAAEWTAWERAPGRTRSDHTAMNLLSSAALEAAGFAVTLLREPQPKIDGTEDRLLRFKRAQLFLWLKAKPLE